MGTASVFRCSGAPNRSRRSLRTFHIVPNLRLVQLTRGLSVADAAARYSRYSDVMYAEPKRIASLRVRVDAPT